VSVATRDLAVLLREMRRASDPTPAGEVGEADASAFLARPDIGNPYVAPESELQKALVSMWESMLEIRGLGIEDNFFELGGHSLLLTRLISRLNRERGISLPMEQAFEVATIAHWSALASSAPAAASTAPARPITRIDRSKYKVLSSEAT
jgi:acyl carrier protein